MGAIKSGTGIVYAVLFADGSVKIGMTRNMNKRLAALNTHSPYPVIRSLYGEINYPKEMESELHELFKDNRTHGEFFRFDRDDWVKLVNFWGYDEWAKESGFYNDIFSFYENNEDYSI